MEGDTLGYQLYTDEHVAAPARWIARKASDGAPTFLYVYTHVLSLQRGRVSGANHGAELPFVFDVWDKALPQLPLDETDRAVTKLMHSCWTSFAKTGTPQCEGTPAWPRYDAESAPVIPPRGAHQVPPAAARRAGAGLAAEQVGLSSAGGGSRAGFGSGVGAVTMGGGA